MIHQLTGIGGDRLVLRVIDFADGSRAKLGRSHIMGFSKDGEGGEGPSLSLVGGNPQCVPSPGADATDKATLAKLAELKAEHRGLDEEILALSASGTLDQLQLTRLKKRKLMLRDLISRLENEMVPDIIA